jgi:hypothetical protein
MENQTKPKRRRRPKTNKNLYFTQIHEQAITQYVKSNDIEERNKIYTEILQPALREIIDKITTTFKFTNLPNINSEKDICEVWLQQNIDKFNPDKNFKAFGYFSVITKNYFIALGKDQKKFLAREVETATVSNILEQKYLSIENDYEKTREQKEFFDDFWEEMIFWENKMPLSENDRRVLTSVKGLFIDPTWEDAMEEGMMDLDKYITDPREIEKMRRKFHQPRFLKTKFYELIEEDTKLNRKQIGQSIKKLKEYYKLFKAEGHDYLV